MAFVPWDAFLSTHVDLAHTLAASSTAHPLGTDNLGRDLLVRLSSAVRGAVLPLWLGVLAGSAAGILLATIARRARLLDLGATLLASIPVAIVAFGWAALREQAGLLPVLASLSAVFAVRSYLEVKDLFRHDKDLAYWTAHAALGGTESRRLWRYGVLTGWRAPLLQSLGFNLRAAVAIEASLSYLGFGVAEPQASFGNMLASHFELYVRGQVGILVLVVLALLLTAATPGAAVNLATRLMMTRGWGRFPRSRTGAARTADAVGYNSPEPQSP